MKREDSEALAALDKRCFSVPWSEKSFLEEYENPVSTYLIARDEEIVGYCGFWKVSGEVQITNIAVLPEYRRRGIAAKLLEKMLSDCGDCERFVLEVRISNESAIALYEKFGFKKAGIRKRFYREPVEDGITMIRGEV